MVKFKYLYVPEFSKGFKKLTCFIIEFIMGSGNC